ncbi:Hypothetical protein NCS54_01182800 [Fusarium falciforme]|uniref:Hypothetical protein n=1 Tax=Fusarium falciforme TaxID=195108 RepID=UPI002301D8E1|nr:Hypothetical protein NCS54_01182800 [Fusarium falciforme]WAO94253.1 Hypothetical protein NCS54_01182800 [Fusarium falciforme]
MISTAEVEAVMEDGDEDVGEDVEVDMNHGQGYGQEDYEDGNRRNSSPLARSEVSDLREQLRGKEEEVVSLRRALTEKNEAFQSKVEELESVKRELESAIQAKLDLRS